MSLSQNDSRLDNNNNNQLGSHRLRSKLSTNEIERIEFALEYYRHLRNLRHYVSENMGEPIKLSDVADNIGISVSRLSRLFHEKTGFSYTDWISCVRIAEAQHLLSTSDASITDISYTVGYRNARTFERAFRKSNGQSASQFRRNIVTQRTPHK